MDITLEGENTMSQSDREDIKDVSDGGYNFQQGSGGMTLEQTLDRDVGLVGEKKQEVQSEERYVSHVERIVKRILA